VACQLDYLDSLPTDRLRRLALKKLPPTLNETYQRILEAGSSRDINDPHTRSLMKKALWWIGNEKEPLTIPQLCEALSIEDGDEAIDAEDVIKEGEILRLCSSLIRKSHDGREFEFAHFTVQEYLQSIAPDSPVADFRFSQRASSCTLAETSLRLLMFPEFDCIPSAKDSPMSEVLHKKTENHPFYDYAGAHWMRHIPDDLSADEKLGPMAASFLDPKATTSWNWLFWFAYVMDQVVDRDGVRGREEWLLGQGKIVDNISRAGLGPLHLASVLQRKELCQYLIGQGADVNAKSQYGSPLLCANIGLGIFLRDFSELSLDNAHLFPLDLRDEYVSIPSPIIHLLLDHGASHDSKSKRYSISPARIALFFCLRSGLPGSFLAFVKHRWEFDQDDLEVFEAMSEAQQHDMYLDEVVQHIISSYTGTDAPSWASTSATMARFIYIARKLSLKYWDYPDEIELPADFHSSVPDQDFFQILQDEVELDRWDDVSKLMNDLRYDARRGGGMFEDGRTIVHIAAWHRAERTMTELIGRGCDLNCQDLQGNTPMMLGITRKPWSQCRWLDLRLLLKAGALSTVANNDGWTIWHQASREGDVDLLRVLLEHDNPANRY